MDYSVRYKIDIVVQEKIVGELKSSFEATNRIRFSEPHSSILNFVLSL